MGTPLHPVSRLDVAERLRTVIDPELGINIVDLGLVYDLRVGVDGVEVDITMTTPACPLSSYITQQIEVALRLLAGDGAIRVELVWSPRWSPAMMAETVRPGRRPAADRSLFHLFR